MGGWKTGVAAVVVALAAACGGDDDAGGEDSSVDLGAMAEAAKNAPPCADVFEPGRPTGEVLAAAADAGICEQPGGANLITGTMSWDCPDGRSVHVVDGWGWGFSGDAWQGPDMPEPYADCVLPGTDAQHPLDP